ncbi:LacI family DNA-binding transcriptional regulator [Devosia sp. ZB163]|uniref:LacI family DNA-binding transcriptional regulator n=1 Tax=Devosia sp. ZB163 TaxID=3025938 RepID=UPI00235E6449|nr:LacI family DNA-binding transcriptional regulator [Devosia sp. ZB163]MDC9824862.1 LacI family DNA-binding transcriptional regulator [Devosia sp. ZB163]
MARATIKDIALAANVSPMTVSNVLNGRRAKASDETVERIMVAVRELGYRPNMSARSLVSNASRMVGVVIPFTETQNQLLLDNPFYAEMISGIESALRQNGYYMMLSGVGESNAQLDTLSHWNMDGLIVLGVYREGLYQHLRELDLPTLLIDSYIDDAHFHHLRLDDEAAAYAATSHLIARGHTGIALVTGVIRTSGVIERRLAGYKRALSEAGIGFDAARVLSGSVTFDWGAEAADRLTQLPGVTAAFCTADLIAAGLLAGLHRLGRRIPEDYSVMGFDNLPVSRMVYPALTTVDQSILEKGKLAGDLIARVLRKEAAPRESTTDVRIVERDSVLDRRPK